MTFAAFAFLLLSGFALLEVAVIVSMFLAYRAMNCSETLPAHSSLITFLPAGNRPPERRERIRKAIVRFVVWARLQGARVVVWSDRVHWATVGDVLFLPVFFGLIWAVCWVAYAMGWWS